MADLVRLLICCGQRVQETLRIDGAEIDLDAALWTMPAHKTKGRKHVHVIPLPRQALPILRRLKAKRGDGPLFPARKGSKSALISHRSVNQALGRWLDLESTTVADFQSRDLRRTWKSRAHDAGVDRFTRDLIQQHAKHDTGSKNYDRSDYLPQMRAAMDSWSMYLEHVIISKNYDRASKKCTSAYTLSKRAMQKGLDYFGISAANDASMDTTLSV